jgi:hypothetical protein
MTRRVLWLYALVVAMALLLIGGAAPAAASGDWYAAIAVEKPTRAVGWAWGYAKLSKAKYWALKECKVEATKPSRCQMMVTVKNGCAAVAYKTTASGYTYGSATGPSKNAAKSAALQAAGKNAKLLKAVCTDGNVP